MSEDNRGSWIETYTGGRFYLGDPRSEEVNFEDVAQAISKICRFTGQLKQLWSVGQHCLFVADMLARHAPPDKIEHYAIHGLFHDFEEAYISDLNTPLKRLLFDSNPEFKAHFDRIRTAINRAIYEAGGLEMPTEYEHSIVKFFDIKALILEGYWLFPHQGHTYVHLKIPQLKEMAGDHDRLLGAVVEDPATDPDVDILQKWIGANHHWISDEIHRRVQRFIGN